VSVVVRQTCMIANHAGSVYSKSYQAGSVFEHG